MFARWNLTRNPFDTSPISLGSLDWFVGRGGELELCRRLLTEQSVILVEGELGVGTTSFGNVVRFGAPARTPRMELSAYRGWHAQTLLENVLVAVLHDVEDDPRAQRSEAVSKVTALVQRVERAVHSAGVNVLGFGGQISRNVAVTQPGIVPMETLRHALASLVDAFPPERGSSSFVVQLNNLDQKLTFSDEELITFLNDIRDSLQLPGFGWMLVGKKGLGHFVTRNVPRVRTIISHDVTLSPLSRSEVEEAVDRRIRACALPGEKPENPIDAKVLHDIYEASGGSLRETFMLCSKLSLAIASDPLYDKVTRREAGAVVASLLSARFANIRRSPLRLAILRLLNEGRGLTQTQIVHRLGKSQASISRALKPLIEDELVRCKRDGRNVRYWPAPEVKLAAAHLAEGVREADDRGQ